jgi:thymidylate synthase (FAD)
MRVINPGYEFLTEIDLLSVYQQLEKIARTCYKSEDKITPTSHQTLLPGLIKRGHEAMIEHYIVSVKITCDRGVSHEIVRHRIASYAQESTRYVNYGNKEDGVGIIDIQKHFKNDRSKIVWAVAMGQCERAYLELLELGESPQIARSVLPNSTKTEIVVTMNLREWRAFFKLRVPVSAHPQMREITIPLFQEFKSKLPIIFNDIEV